MKSKQTKTILISCAVILLVACMCIGLVLISGVGVSLLWPLDFQGQPGDPSTTPLNQTPVDITPGGPSATETPSLEAELPDELAATIAEIESQVIDLRGLSIEQSVDHTLISSDELEEIVLKDFLAEYRDEDAQQDVLILSTVGLLPTSFDLKGLYQSLYTEQIAGFYEEESKEIYIVQGEKFGGSEKLTYAHEFTHVLQDATYQFNEGLDYNEEACEQDSERCAAINALIEGDATLTEILWFESYAKIWDYRDLSRDFDNFDSTILDSAPYFLASDLYFPYDYGLTFVQYLYDEGGFQAVDSAFKDPPLSTEQILHPERYPEDVPVQVTLPDLSDVLGQSWTFFDQNVLGEWYIYLILSQGYVEEGRLDEDLASIAAEGWGGDNYAFYINEATNEVTFVLDTIWDTNSDATEFRDALELYAQQRWASADEQVLGQPTWLGENSVSTLLHDGDRTIWVISTSEDLIQSILIALQ